jgi:polyisoprenoid-binding protein YceI
MKNNVLGKFLLISMLTLPFSLPAWAAETYTLDPMHTNIDWRINHFGFSNPSGKFARVEGTLSLDEKKPKNSKVSATITIANLVTGIDKLNEHLESPDFFDMAQFPTATFVSDAVEVNKNDTTKPMAKVHGMLTVHGVSKPVVLDVTLNKIGDNMMHKKTAGFTIHTMLKRSDFGIDKYLPMLGDDVDIHIESEANLTETPPQPAK